MNPQICLINLMRFLDTPKPRLPRFERLVDKKLMFRLGFVYLTQIDGRITSSHENFRQQFSLAEFIVCLSLSFTKRSEQSPCLDLSYTKEVMSFPLSELAK